MYPQSHAYGDLSGEIDIAESFGGEDTVAPHLHLHDAAGADQSQGIDCNVEKAAEDFHTYTLEWDQDFMYILLPFSPVIRP